MEDGTKIITEKRKITELTAPVSTELAEQFLSLLTQHRATCEKGEDCSEGYGTAFFYKITFPSGTEKRYGMMLYSSQSFDIVFPDGFVLHGIEQHTTSGERFYFCLESRLFPSWLNFPMSSIRLRPWGS